MVTAIIVLPFVAGLLLLCMPSTIMRKIILMITALSHLGLTAYAYFIPNRVVMSGWIVLDAIGYIFLALISLLFTLASIYTLGYLPKKHDEETGSERIFLACLLFFLSTMSLVTMSYHLGLLWIAVEATTLASAPLIYFHRTPHAIEATWKYLILCSVGIALALLGTIFLVISTYYEGETLPLFLPVLIQSAARLNPIWLQASFLLFLVGYGTKMGLAPLHSWLPDAHSEAPAPVSALFSGVLLNCAFLALLRIYQIFIAANNAVFVENLLLFFGIFSMLISAVFLLSTTDYKRMLAYSSVEHMGILAVSIGLGATTALTNTTFLHLVNHSLTKALLFLTAGNILLAYRTKNISQVHGCIKSLPVTGILWTAGFLAIVGMPPFGIFISEFNILGVMIRKGQFAVATGYLFLLAIIFIAMVKIVLHMVLGIPRYTSEEEKPKENWSRLISPILLVSAILVLGIYLPDWFYNLLQSAVNQLLGDI